MKYNANSLASIYEIIRGIEGEKAIIDFICGELGNELLISQSMGLDFYNLHKEDKTIIALVWEGTSLLFKNISDHQIELIDRNHVSSQWNKDHYTTGLKRFDFLKKRGHLDEIRSLEGVSARFGPCWLNDGTCLNIYKDSSIVSNNSLVKEYPRLWSSIIRNIQTNKPIFQEEEPLINGKYISIFDRNEKHQPERNTLQRDLFVFENWAKKYDLKLVVYSDLYPRKKIPEMAIRISPEGRDLDTLCNIVNNSILHASPCSGASEVAQVFGCHYLQLCDFGVTGFPDHLKEIQMSPIVESRGFTYFGTLERGMRGLLSLSNKNRKILKRCQLHLQRMTV